MDQPRTLFEKVWDSHVVAAETSETPAVLYIDLHLIHEVTTPQAFAVLRERGVMVRCPERTLATLDHSTPTLAQDLYGARADTPAFRQVGQMERNCEAFGIALHGIGSDHRGIVHVMGPELGATQPGSTIVCGDSHTATHGAFGALAFGIGTTEVGHVLATQCLLQRKPRTLGVHLDGQVPAGVSAKDIILAVIGKLGVDGGTGHVIEYTGAAIRRLSMDGRMTVCNMSIEAGARAGMIAPDDTTFEYLANRPMAPAGELWEQSLARWAQLPSDTGARYDREVHIDASQIAPMITYGTNPGMVMPVTGTVPQADDASARRALEYMGLQAGEPMVGRPVNVAFVGSCTNARMSDLRQAAEVLRGRRIAHGVQMLVVPGSQAVKREAEAEGLDKVFTDAGAQWRESGCSMCIAMNGDTVGAGQYAISTSNRNFEGRQGKGARTLLASPASTAAAAVKGCVTDARALLG